MRNLLIGVTGSVAAIKIDNLALSLLPYFNIKIIFTQSVIYLLMKGFEIYYLIATLKPSY